MFAHAAAFLLPLVSNLVAANAAPSIGSEWSCKRFLSSVKVANTSLITANYFTKGSPVPVTGRILSCGGDAVPLIAATNVCRIVVNVTTTPTSSVIVEGWLPDSWNQRFLASGNGGIGGCIDYQVIEYGVDAGFASFGTNGGHNGSSGYDFWINRPEVINDFGYRAIHIEAVVGKALTAQYYHSAAKKNYYAGCSTGGRQAIGAALWYPEDFDGVVAGSPGINWIRIVAERGILAKRFGWPDVNSPAYITNAQWNAITAAQIKFLDPLDGVTDGVIDDPTAHMFIPELLRCGTGVLNASLCLRSEQIQGVRDAYQPLFNTSGEQVYPAFDLGAPTTSWSFNIVNGTPALMETILQDFWRGAVYNDTKWNATSFCVADMDFATNIDPGRINTWDPRLGAFYKRGGKILSYHGRMDNSVTSMLSIEYYDWVQATLGLTTKEMQSFYSLFLVPGLLHCTGGPGANYLGQPALGPLNSTDPKFKTGQYNVLQALMDWTEKGKAPTSITGTKWLNDTLGSSVVAQRKHCLYPSVSKWNGKGDTKSASSWNCVDFTGGVKL